MASPIEIDKFREEVQARLKEIDNPRLSAAFAVRVALAALPMLAHWVEKKLGSYRTSG
uniref:Uncharacterized protein n=1 Tax=Candidatus Kentrum sp. FM TaxID=2126340 RepID=A0A450SUS6_9GAMM|nr:MAG: hypothetical protein BECKFM1743A_GA0114220_101992 [Candidatus Kentron sp. FM]